jgi:hypothetical protein
MHTNNTYTHTHTSPTSCYCQLRKYDVSVHKVNTDVQIVHPMLCIQCGKCFGKGPTKVCKNSYFRLCAIKFLSSTLPFYSGLTDPCFLVM